MVPARRAGPLFPFFCLLRFEAAQAFFEAPSPVLGGIVVRGSGAVWCFAVVPLVASYAAHNIALTAVPIAARTYCLEVQVEVQDE